MFGLYYLIRDVFVSMAALGGAFLWQISPEANFVTAFVFGVIGTIGFSDGSPLQSTKSKTSAFRLGIMPARVSTVLPPHP